MKTASLIIGTALVVAGIGIAVRQGMALNAAPKAQAGAGSSGQPATPGELDRLLAPIALYPDQLLAQMLLCATDPAGVVALDAFLKRNAALKGTELQDAALKDNFQPSFVALALFPQVVQKMADQINATTRLGQAFTANRSDVFDAIQRLRKQAQSAGTLKTTAQQEVETQTTSGGQQVIVIEPANPQIVYVPQYNPAVVYVQQPTTVVVEQNNNDAAVAGLVGFAAGIAIGAAVDNDYYYGPYGWRGGGYMYNDAWNDYYDHREDAREDWMDHREDLVEERGDRASDAREQRTDRAETRQENRPENRSAAQTQRQGTATAARTNSTGTRSPSATYEARGNTQTRTTTAERSGTRSDAFSGYSSGKSERAASTRGQSSRSSSRGGGGRRR